MERAVDILVTALPTRDCNTNCISNWKTITNRFELKVRNRCADDRSNQNMSGTSEEQGKMKQLLDDLIL